tara:strand:+ start:299 stop:994 length:696 start_codon:yes stop_codon:yes gene_type:complete
MIQSSNKTKIKFLIISFFLLIFILVSYTIYKNINFFSIANVSNLYAEIDNKVSKNYFTYYLFFFVIYFLVAVFALPIAAILCLIIGALFGLIPGIILASFASSLGALVCFLLSRYLFKNFIEKKFDKSLKIINAGIAKDGIYYLFFVRMIPIFPFFLINLLFSVTQIRALNFYIASQIGMLLGTLLFINAGTQLSKINSIEDIFNKYVIISLVLIALIPIVIKKIFVYYKS